MAETRILAPVLDLVERAEGKAILIGDPHQLPAVGAGGLFAGIVEREGAVVLHREPPAARRARTRGARARPRRTSAATTSPTPRSASGSSSPRARSPRGRGCSPTGGSTRATTSPATSCSPSAAPTSPTSTSSPAPSWTPTGASGHDRLAIADREFAAGDRVVCLRNSDRLGVKNGTRGTVDTSTANARTLDRRAPTAAPTRRAQPPVPRSRQRRHAYALTGHAAQGLTVERAFVLGSGEARLQEWGYVALSRARTETRLYVTGTPREHESHFHDLDDRDPLARFGRALEESAVEELAVDQKPLPSGPRHDARPEIERTHLSPEGLLQRRLLEQKKLALTKTQERRAAPTRRRGATA